MIDRDHPQELSVPEKPQFWLLWDTEAMMGSQRCLGLSVNQKWEHLSEVCPSLSSRMRLATDWTEVNGPEGGKPIQARGWAAIALLWR